MQVFIFIALGLVGTAITGYVLVSGVNGRVGSPESRMVAAAFGLVVWGVWAQAAFNVTVVTDSGAVVTESYRDLAYLGVIAGLPLVYGLYKDGVAQLEDAKT